MRSKRRAENTMGTQMLKRSAQPRNPKHPPPALVGITERKGIMKKPQPKQTKSNAAELFERGRQIIAQTTPPPAASADWVNTDRKSVV